MNKKELVQAVAKTSKKSQHTVGLILDSITDQIATELSSGGEVSLRGFGRYTTKLRAERTGRNPQTGVKINIPEKTVTLCKLSQTILKGGRIVSRRQNCLQAEKEG
jgi:DNA-binding protein HU-beta